MEVDSDTEAKNAPVSTSPAASPTTTAVTSPTTDVSLPRKIVTVHFYTVSHLSFTVDYLTLVQDEYRDTRKPRIVGFRARANGTFVLNDYFAEMRRSGIDLMYYYWVLIRQTRDVKSRWAMTTWNQTYDVSTWDEELDYIIFREDGVDVAIQELRERHYRMFPN